MGCITSSEDGARADGGAHAELATQPTSLSYVETRNGYPETLTPAQRATMAELRSQLAREGHAEGRWDDDHEMCRWLRARKFDIAATKLMILNHIRWEKEYDVDHVYRTFAHKDAAGVKAAYPRTYHRADRVGRPINIDRVGMLNIKRINELTNDDDMEREKIQDMVSARARRVGETRTHRARQPKRRAHTWYVCAYALLRAQEYTVRVRYPACSLAAGRTINQSLVIMDLSGLSFAIWNAQTRNMLKRLTSVLSDHYPETMGALFIVNAPSFFAAIWSVAKLVLDPGTVQKISILSSNYKTELFKHVEPHNLPTFLGGTDETFDFMREQGSWVVGTQPTQVPSAVRSEQVNVHLPDQRRPRWVCCAA